MFTERFARFKVSKIEMTAEPRVLRHSESQFRREHTDNSISDPLIWQVRTRSLEPNRSESGNSPETMSVAE